MNKTERQVNLVFLLMKHKRGITRAQIRENISDYRAATTDASFERMFERDKQEIKVLGFLIENYQDPFAGSDEIYYKINEDESLMDASKLSLEQKILFQIARNYIYESTLESNSAFIKLETIPNLAEIQIGENMISMRNARFKRILEAIDQNKALEFDYKGTADHYYSKRIIYPYRLIIWNNRQYLVGFSPEVGAFRTFRLDRLGDYLEIGEMFSADADFDIATEFQDFVETVRNNIECKIKFKRAELIQFPESVSVKTNWQDNVLTLFCAESDEDKLYYYLLGVLENIDTIEPPEFKSQFIKYLKKAQDVQI